MTSVSQALHYWDRVIEANPNSPKAYVQRGMVRFKLGQIDESIQDFDQAEALDPHLTPYLWQRGLSYYYANRFADGAKQFEIDLAVNGQDVEETVWRYLCMAQIQGAAAARNALLPVKRDPRPIMKLIYDMFAGKANYKQVLNVGLEKGTQAKFYSLLYVGLYFEAAGNPEQAQAFISYAAQVFQTEYQSDDYMGYLAIVHQTQRGWGSVS
jgi:tetratricopeptide (TPR) repeat protein